MRKILISTTCLIMLITPVNAGLSEDGARKEATEYFDQLMVECPALKAKLSGAEYAKSPVCADFTLPFHATKRIPDWAAYREMWIEMQVVKMVRLQVWFGTLLPN